MHSNRSLPYIYGVEAYSYLEIVDMLSRCTKHVVAYKLAPLTALSKANGWSFAIEDTVARSIYGD
jgi:hypothetical protein